MSTFREAASIRTDIWLICYPCKRALHLGPCDPLIADHDMDVGFRCQQCGAISRAKYVGPNERAEGWIIEDRS